MIKPIAKTALVIVLALAAFSLVTSALLTSSKWLTTAGLLLDIAGLIQLDISGVFERIFEEYNDVDKYPFGPPSTITRQVIDHPDRPIRNALRIHAFQRGRTGFVIIVLGCVAQLAAVWIWTGP